jgi:DNA repair protein RadC
MSAKAVADEEDKRHYYGHRQRLREKLLQAGGDALQDYELLEVLLFTAIPRRDVKPLAKQLLAEFKNLWSLINAPPERLIQFGLSESAAADFDGNRCTGFARAKEGDYRRRAFE